MGSRKELELDMLELYVYLKKKLWVIVASVVVCAELALVITLCFLEPQYTADTRIYVLSRGNENKVSYSDFQISNVMLDDYVVLITGKNVTKEVIRELELDMTPEELEEMIQVTAPGDARVVEISVTDTDPQRAAAIANCVRENASEQIMVIMDLDTVNLVYAADPPQEKSGPDVVRNVALAALLGLIGSVVTLTVMLLLREFARLAKASGGKQPVVAYRGQGD